MKNQSEFFVHLQKDGVTESFGPGEDIPAWAASKINNPYVSGKQDSEDEPVVDEPKVAVNDGDDEAPKTRRGRARS